MQSACIASKKPRVQIPVLPNKQKLEDSFPNLMKSDNV
jgi:hypothetical protein